MDNPYARHDLENRITKPNDALKYILELESLDLSKISDEELEKLLDKYFPYFPLTSGTILAGTELFRARANINNKSFNEVKDIYTPAPELINSYGRANKPHEQIFYCASNYLLAAFEVINNLKYYHLIGNPVAFLTIGIWRVKEDLHVSNIIHSQKLHSIRKDIYEHYQRNLDIMSKGQYRLKDDTINSTNLICQFFSDQFTKDTIKTHFDYRISALYARRIKEANGLIAPQYSSDKFDGLNYPSVAMKFKGDNQALFMDSVENKLEIVNAIQVICANFNFDKGEFLPGVLHEAESIKDGIIKWKEEIYRPKESHEN